MVVSNICNIDNAKILQLVILWHYILEFEMYSKNSTDKRIKRFKVLTDLSIVLIYDLLYNEI